MTDNEARRENRVYNATTLLTLSDHWENDLAYAIACVAIRYWAYTPDGEDFCVQHVGPESIVFGSTNRLVWSPARGFVPDRSACTERFLAHYHTLGPTPGTFDE